MNNIHVLNHVRRKITAEMPQRRGKETSKPCIAAINALKQEAKSLGAVIEPHGEVGKMEAPQQPHQGNKNMNFGWFSLPGAVPDAELETRTDRTDQNCPQVPASRAGYPPDIRSNLQSRSANRPPSHMSVMCGQLPQGPPPVSNYVCPPSRSGYRPRTQQSQIPNYIGCAQQGGANYIGCAQQGGEGVDRLIVESQACEQGQGEGPCLVKDGDPESDPNYEPVNADGHILDWPMSSAAQEYMKRVQPPAASRGHQARPGTRGCQVPQTPMPPLAWAGYGRSARPTYATWHDEWHKTSTSQHKSAYHVGGNMNNSCCSGNMNNSCCSDDTEDVSLEIANILGDTLTCSDANSKPVSKI
ncbi:hypothetical protein Btru_062352 [Bulinus truncatus]|nr:hypothetical protein Btru_062352 [Bulinus truncatus]